MSNLKQYPTIQNFQKYVSELEKERGFENDNVMDF